MHGVIVATEGAGSDPAQADRILDLVMAGLRAGPAE